jgi:hypothetical protein
MSGSPKYSSARLERERRERLERERQIKAEAEKRQREEAIARERKIRLENLRTNLIVQTDRINQKISSQKSLIYGQDFDKLQTSIQQLKRNLHNALTENNLHNFTPKISNIDTQLYQAVSRKRRDEEEKQRKQEIEQLQFELSELEAEIKQVSDFDGNKFDSQGRQQAEKMLGNLRQLIKQGNPQTVKNSLKDTQTIVKNHLNLVTKNKQKWEQEKLQAEQILSEMNALINGLKADHVITTWCIHLINELESFNVHGEKEIASENFSKLDNLLTNLQQQSEEIIKIANEAQLKADQRDYIADSIAQSLTEMGFNLVYRQAEYPDHPATAIILGAATNSGKGISVSVPVEGEVYYDIDGYTKTGAVCDEAENVINEMHNLLEQEFGVKMSELLWEGKDPNRNIKSADELPNNINYRGLDRGPRN